MGRALVLAGVALVLVGLLIAGLERWVGSGERGLPGDIVIRRGNWTYHFPVVTCLVIRTARPLFQSRPGRLLGVGTLAVGVVAVTLPYVPLMARVFGFVPLSPWTLLQLGVITLLLAALIFFLGYVPNIGVVIAWVPAVALAFLQHGTVTAVVVLTGLILINYIDDYLIGPRMMSRGLGLSQFTVFLSFFFWTYLLGVVGGLLAVPLTLFVKLLLDANAETRWLAVLMAESVPGLTEPAAAPATATTGAPQQVESERR